MTRRALVVSHTLLQRDPRVAREVEWLTGDGWTVDTVGLGAAALPQVRRHFEFAPEARWLRPVIVKGLLHSLTPYGLRFRLLMEKRLPRELVQSLRADEYDLVLVNDIQLLRLIDHLPADSQKVHIDLHELHAPNLNAKMRGARLANGYFRWTRAAIAAPRVKSRSVVARGIAHSYRDELGIPEPHVVMNCPPHEEMDASTVREDRVDLIYHGAASWARGLGELIDAVKLLPDRFHLNLILVGNEALVSEISTAAAVLGDRVSLLPPVPVRDIATRINEFDLEVMFFPPSSESLRFALPNKLFEAIQARIGVVIGESPMMVEIVEEYGNGVIVTGWDATDLATAIEAITPEDIARYKKGSDRAAADLNAEHEREVFLAIADTFGRA